MNFAELPPSKQWAALKYRGEKFAEVWFKPEGEPSSLTFRIPRESFDLPGMGPLLTADKLLKAVAIAAEDVASWRHGDAPGPGADGSDPNLRQPLPPPPPDASHLSVHVRLKAPPQPAAPGEGGEPEALAARWVEIEGRWRAILGVEASIDTMRLTLEGLQTEMQTSLGKTLTLEEKLNALNADVASWNKAKSRIHFTLPKVRDFIHRATWALGAPERKELGEVFKEDARPDLPLPQLAKLVEELEYLLKNRQVLSALGTSVYQECKSTLADVQGALRTLLSNAAVNADRKRRAARPKGGKFFKHVRKWSGAD
jgi:hypothetical protein